MSASINAIASAAEEMSVNIQTVHSSAEQMSQNMSAVAAAIEEMSMSINYVAGSAQEGSDIAEKAMEMAVDYAKIRYQFGQPIGSYQAIKHLCSDMFLEVESARSVLYWAAWAQDHGDADEAALAASVSKAYCSEIYKHVSAAALL